MRTISRFGISELAFATLAELREWLVDFAVQWSTVGVLSKTTKYAYG